MEFTPFMAFAIIVGLVIGFLAARQVFKQRDHEVDPPGPAGDVVRGQREAQEKKDDPNTNWMEGEAEDII
jgi:hypothetical protein